MTSPADIQQARELLKSQLCALGIEDQVSDVNWTYGADGEHIPTVDKAGTIVMGFNAGAGGTGSEARWRNKATKLTRTVSPNFQLAELILIASHDIDKLRRDQRDIAELMRLCAPVNQAIIAFHQPRIIFQTGFGYMDLVVEVYGLVDTCRSESRPSGKAGTLVKHYVIRESGTPWLCVRHPSSWGFSTGDLEGIQAYATEVCQNRAGF